MGMAASQAKLLSITSRMHDIEYKAQNIMNQKTTLATQKDDLYENYLEALDAKKIQVAYADGISRNYVDATFATVCKYDPARCVDYTLKDSKTGKVIVDSKTYDIYTNQGYDNDKYAFAWAMLGMGEMGSWNGEDDCMFIGYGLSNTTESGNLFMTEVEQLVYDNLAEDIPQLKTAWESFQTVDKDESKSDGEKQKALKEFRNVLYSFCGAEIYQGMRLDKESGDAENPTNFNANYPENYDDISGELQYYLHLYEAIQDAGGCIDLEKFCEDGDSGNEWFNNAVNSGQVTISVYNKYGTNTGWTDTSVATSTNQNYLQEVPDESDLKKAEAEYQHELDIVNQKDKRFDNDLNKLETERTSLKTEMDSIKKVRDDNIDKTFKIFS